MYLFAHCCSYTRNNCYIVGAEAHKSEALIIDPGYLDERIIQHLEENEYTLQAILVTHEHTKLMGIRSLKRIYDVPIYAVSKQIFEFKTQAVKDRQLFSIGAFTVEALLVPGHTQDSVVFRLEHLLFTGDALQGGLVGRVSSAYGGEVQMKGLQQKIMTLPRTSVHGEFVVLPCHGPPSLLESEQKSNLDILRYKAPEEPDFQDAPLQETPSTSSPEKLRADEGTEKVSR